MKKPKLFLTGLMGSGKTTVGKLLAKRLGWNFFDTDLLIEKQAGLSVRQIFARWGEGRFRRMETLALARASRLGAAVISTGGGIPVSAANRCLMRAAGLQVYLRVPLKQIVKRMGAKALKKRPMLASDAVAALKTLAGRRAAVYRQAEISVRADVEPGQVVDRILRQIQKKKPGFFG